MYGLKDKAYSLDDILNFIIGDISSHGDSHFDRESFSNLSKAELVLNWILERLVSNYEQRNSSWGSVAAIGKESERILDELYEGWLYNYPKPKEE